MVGRCDMARLLRRCCFESLCFFAVFVAAQRQASQWGQGSDCGSFSVSRSSFRSRNYSVSHEFNTDYCCFPLSGRSVLHGVGRPCPSRDQNQPARCQIQPEPRTAGTLYSRQWSVNHHRPNSICAYFLPWPVGSCESLTKNTVIYFFFSR